MHPFLIALMFAGNVVIGWRIGMMISYHQVPAKWGLISALVLGFLWAMFFQWAFYWGRLP